MASKSSVGVIVSAVVIFAASFLPWGSFDAAPDIGSPGEAFREAFGEAFGVDFPVKDMRMTFIVTGWDGALSLFGMKLPNSSAVISGLVVGVLAVLGACSGLHAHPVVSFSLCCYGLFHTAILSKLLFSSDDASPGAGVLIAVASFVTMLFLLLLELRDRRHRSTRRRWLNSLFQVDLRKVVERDRVDA